MKIKNPNAIGISVGLFFFGLGVMAVVPGKSIMNTFGGGIFLIGLVMICYFGIQEFKK